MTPDGAPDGASPPDDDPVGVALAPERSLPARIVHWAGREPDRPFLTEVGGRTASYGELHEQLRCWCTLLRRLGVAPGDRIASFLPPSIDAHLVWLAASCIGAYEVPVDPQLRGGLLSQVLTDAGVRLCLTRPEAAGLPRSSGVDGLEVVEVSRDGRGIAGLPPAPLDPLPGPGDVATVIYTSGTTGDPKGVVMPWAQLSSSIGRIPPSWLGDDPVVYAPWPMYHVTGRTPLVAMADVGGRVVLRERFSLGEFWADVRAYGCTSTSVGPIAPLLLAADPCDGDADNPLRTVLMGSLGDKALALQRRFDVRVVGAYGSTEVAFPLVHRGPGPDNAAVTGRLRPGYRARVVDGDGKEVPDGTVGELQIAVAAPEMMMRGYLGRPELTRRRLVEGWYRTGDAFVRDAEGWFRFVGRLGDTIRRFAENIAPAPIEEAAAGLPGVAECAAVGIDSPVCGEEVVLVVVPGPRAPGPEELFEGLRARLARHMLPAYIAIVPELPRTPNAKVARREVRDRVPRLELWRSPAAVRSTGDQEPGG